MSILLEGGCRVIPMREGTPLRRESLSLWQQIGRAIGAQAISLRILEFAAGVSPGLTNKDCDEVLYLLEPIWSEDEKQPQREATVFIDGHAYEVSVQTGIYLRPRQTLTVSNPGSEPLLFISSQCPDPDSQPQFSPPLTSPGLDSARPELPPIVRLADRRAIATADRWYRVLVDDEVGSTQVTQFVGSIPPGRAPDHFHEYEEVLFILRGEGRMWAGKTNTTIGPGSCVYLPRGQRHCVENTGTAELRLLGVFYPAGSPSVSYSSTAPGSVTQSP